MNSSSLIHALSMMKYYIEKINERINQIEKNMSDDESSKNSDNDENSTSEESDQEQNLDEVD